MTNGSLMKVESIAECSDWSILQYFDLHKAIIGLENKLCFLEWPFLRGFTVGREYFKWSEFCLYNYVQPIFRST